jgi:hypothetical protein
MIIFTNYLIQFVNIILNFKIQYNEQEVNKCIESKLLLSSV